MTDHELYRKAKFYGKNALLWRQKFMGLLPEVNRRRLYEKKGFPSIFMFAYKLAGLSEEQVRRVLCLEKRFEALPVLQGLLVSGEVSVNKLARVASVATPENEQNLAEAVKVLPQSAVETLIKDGSNKPQMDTKTVRAHDLKLSPELMERLLALQEKGININEILTEFLDRREQEIAEEKIAIAEELPERQTRPIPARTRRVLSQEHGSKCSIHSCTKPAEHIHHTQTFALSHRHDPHYLAPLCKDHHLLAHAINMKVQERRELATR